MNRALNWIYPLLFVWTLSAPLAWAQSTMSQQATEASFVSGLELYDKKYYAAARDVFARFLQSQPEGEYALQAEFYITQCALYLEHPDFEVMLDRFVQKNPTHLMALNAYYNAGNYYFNAGNYKEAARYFVGLQRSGQSERDMEVAYKLGYAYFTEKKYRQASDMFAKVRDGSSVYAIPASYYSGYLAYQENQLEQALEFLRRASALPEYENDANILITNIYYKQGRYKDVISFAERAKSQQGNIPDQMSLMVGDSYYMAEQYAQALPYLEAYVRKNRNNASREVQYRLAYSYAQTRQGQQAAPIFGKIAEATDSLAQLSAYHMAIVYIELKQKQAASNAFRRARELNASNNLREISAYNLVKVSYDIADFKATVEAGEFYEKNFPKGRFQDEVNQIVANAYLNGGDNEAAIRFIERQPNKNRTVLAAYQRVTFNRAAELYNEGNARRAMLMLQKSLQNNIDKSITDASNFWMGEMYSQSEKYDSALIYYRRVPSLATEYATALFGMGYASYNLSNYSQALEFFRTFTNVSNNESRLRTEAFTRIGDCYYVTKNYSEALSFYNQALRMGGGDIEYIYYQLGRTQSEMQRFDDANRSLDLLISRFPKSRYASLAMFQKAENTFYADRKDQTVDILSRLIRQYPDHEIVPVALYRRGTSYVNMGNLNAAVNDYKEILDRYTTDPTAASAIQSLIELSSRVAVRDLDRYRQKFTAANPNSKAALETEFLYARQPYDNQNYPEAINRLRQFVQKAQGTAFANDAHYFLADSYEMTNDTEKAIESYAQVKGGSFEQASLLRSGELLLSSNRSQEALGRLQRVIGNSSATVRQRADAHSGAIRASFAQKDYGQVELLAADVDRLNLSRAKSVADLYIGKVMMERGRLDDALAQFRNTANRHNDEFGAEAHYMAGVVLRRQGNTKASTNELIKINNKFSNFQDWVLESFLLIADNYIDEKDTFQAKATLQSIIDKSQDADIRARARAKLNSL